MCRKKNVNRSVRMCAPSTSASAMITTRWYRAFSRSNSSSPMPVPIAVISAWISAFCSALSRRAFSTFRILPRIGRMAWIDRSLACFAELGLGLALELRIAQLHRHDADEPLADVLAEEIVLLLLQQALVARVAVDDVRERLLQTLLVHPALVRVDRVREGVDGLRVTV